MKMFKSALFLALFITNLISSDDFVDFGIVGKTYEIYEENGNDFIQRRIRETDWQSIENEIKDEIQASFKSNINLPDSKKDFEEESLDLVPSRWDIRNIEGEIVVKKGDLIPSILPFGAKLEICFISGKEDKKVIDYILKDFGSSCIYLVDGVDSREFEELFNVESYPMAEQNLIFLQRFNIDSVPTKITKSTDKITKKTIDIVSLRKLILLGALK